MRAGGSNGVDNTERDGVCVVCVWGGGVGGWHVRRGGGFP